MSQKTAKQTRRDRRAQAAGPQGVRAVVLRNEPVNIPDRAFVATLQEVETGRTQRILIPGHQVPLPVDAECTVTRDPKDPRRVTVHPIGTCLMDLEELEALWRTDNVVTWEPDQIPEPHRTRLAELSAADRVTLDEEPAVRSFVRPFIPGETWPAPPPPGCYAVRVYRDGPTGRYCVPICEPEGAPA